MIGQNCQVKSEKVGLISWGKRKPVENQFKLRTCKKVMGKLRLNGKINIRLGASNSGEKRRRPLVWFSLTGAATASVNTIHVPRNLA